jgi:multidrug efflux pump subunit AcrB
LEKNQLAAQFPDVRAFFQSGSMVDAILNSGMPAPIDVQVNTRDLDLTYGTAPDLARRFHQLPEVGQIYIPRDMNYPAIRLNVDRVHAGEPGRYNLGLSTIVELTQALLNVTSADIQSMNAKYDYQSQYATLQYTMGALR